LTWIHRSGKPDRVISAAGHFLGRDLNANGTRVATARSDESRTSIDIWLIDLARNDGGIRLTSNPAGEFDPSWSRNGSEIALTSSRPAGFYSLFRRPSQEGGQEELLVTADGLAAPEVAGWSLHRVQRP
jgi:Tol biopolymer transport system component